MDSQAGTVRPRVLVVDDSRLMRVAARRILADDYEVVEAGDGEQGWAVIADDDRLALVVSDLSMPVLDGVGLVRRLRAHESERLREIPVIIVTGAEDDDVQTKAAVLEAGASDFIHKPFDPVHLLARARAHVRYSDRTRSLRERHAALERSSSLDPVTGLANRRQFEQRGHQQLAYAVRHRTELAVLRIRLDDIDALTGEAGQSAARQVADVLRGRLRREDTAARLNETEFAVLLPGANPVGARRLADALCTDIAKVRFPRGSTQVPVQARAGVAAPIIQRSTRFEALLEEAGRALSPASPAPEPEPPAEPAPDLDTALDLLARDAGARVRPHLRELVTRVMPLLEAWNGANGRDLDEALERLRSSLRG